MAVFRVSKNKNYTVMSNHHLRDKNLSLKAKGLLSQMLSLPEEWDYTVSGLCQINKENKTAIKAALSELKGAGYLIVTKLMPNQTKSGRIEYIYDIYEKPALEIQPTEKQGIENQGLENHPQLNTNILSTKELNKDKVSKDNYLHPEAEICATKLRDGILAIYPNNAGARKKDCIERWAVDIDKMHRLDGRSWVDIEQAIDWALRDKFWQRNIWSGANLRKHYDRLEADARMKFLKNGTITVGGGVGDIDITNTPF